MPNPQVLSSPRKMRAPRLLLRRQMVDGHELDRRPRQDALAPEPALVQHHLAERQVVADGRDQP